MPVQSCNMTESLMAERKITTTTTTTTTTFYLYHKKEIKDNIIH